MKSQQNVSTPSFWKNSKAARSRLLALSTVSLPSSHGRWMVGKPKGSAPDHSSVTQKNKVSHQNLMQSLTSASECVPKADRKSEPFLHRPTPHNLPASRTNHLSFDTWMQRLTYLLCIVVSKTQYFIRRSIRTILDLSNICRGLQL